MAEPKKRCKTDQAYPESIQAIINIANDIQRIFSEDSDNYLLSLNRVFEEYHGKENQEIAWTVLQQIDKSGFLAVKELELWLINYHKTTRPTLNYGLAFYYMYVKLTSPEESEKRLGMLKQVKSTVWTRSEASENLFTKTNEFLNHFPSMDNDDLTIAFVMHLNKLWDIDSIKQFVIEEDCRLKLLQVLIQNLENLPNPSVWLNLTRFEESRMMQNLVSETHLKTLHRNFDAFIRPFQTVMQSDHKCLEASLCMGETAFLEYIKKTEFLQFPAKTQLVNTYNDLLVTLSKRLLKHAYINYSLSGTVMLNSPTVPLPIYNGEKSNIQLLFATDLGVRLSELCHCLKVAGAEINLDPIFVNNMMLTESLMTPRVSRMECFDPSLFWDSARLYVLKHYNFIVGNRKTEEKDLLKLHFKIKNGTNPLAESIPQLCNQSDFGTLDSDPFELKVEFKEEEGKGEGVVRSWFTRVLDELVSPELNIFYLEQESQIYNFSDVKDMQLINIKMEKNFYDLIKFIGLFFVLMMRKDIQSPYRFASHIFYSIFGGAESSDYHKVAQELDPVFYNNLCKLHNPKSAQFDETLDERFDETLDERFHEFSYENQIKECFLGAALSNFPLLFHTPSFLQNTICAHPTPWTLEQFKANTNTESCSDRTRDHLWKWVAEASEDQLLALFKFITARTVFPVHALDTKIFVYNDKSSTENCPTSQTCFHNITFPEYESYEVFAVKLNLCLSLCDTEYFGLV